MSVPVLALFSRSLRVESRAATTYLKRAGLLLLVLFMLLSVHERSGRVAAPGLSFFAPLMYVNLVFISLAGLAYFASAITEEKEEETLGLLKMSSLSAVAILFGKSTSRLVGACLLVLAQLPFTLLAITLGGVSLAQVLAAYATLLAYLVLLCNAALLCSVWTSRTVQATGMAFGLLLVFLSAGPVLTGLAPFLLAVGWLSPLDPAVRIVRAVGEASWQANPCVQLHGILQTGFAGHPISAQVVSNLALGLCFFLLSWATFGRFTREQTGAAPGRGLLFRRTSPLRWFGVGRPWREAVAWKDFHFGTGGRMMVVGRLVGVPGIVALLFLLWQATSREPVRAKDVGGVTMGIAATLAAIEIIGHAARMFQEEVKWGTLPRLMMLPMSPHRLLGAKVLGVLPALAPYALLLVIGAWLNPQGFADAARGLLGTAVGWHMVMQYVAFVHFVALLSLFFPRAGGLVAVGVWFVGNVFLIALFRPMAVGGFDAYSVFMCFVLLIFTIVVHAKLLGRLEELAGQ